ncbi:hypothetical protein D3C71_1171590 [compost metagenome]
MLFRIQIGVEDHLSDAAQKADTFGPKAPQTHPTDQRMFIPFLLNRLVHLFQQMLHVMAWMQGAVADKAHVRIDKLEL